MTPWNPSPRMRMHLQALRVLVCHSDLTAPGSGKPAACSLLIFLCRRHCCCSSLFLFVTLLFLHAMFSIFFAFVVADTREESLSAFMLQSLGWNRWSESTSLSNVMSRVGARRDWKGGTWSPIQPDYFSALGGPQCMDTTSWDLFVLFFYCSHG